LSRKTDIWSWGVSILEMFTGEVTWMSGVVAAEVLDSYLEDGAHNPNIPPIPSTLAELLEWCFKRNSQSRPSMMSELVNFLKMIYEEVTGSVYTRTEPKAVELRADALNNRAVSFLDLGKEEDAVQCWQEALEADPHHLQAGVLHLARIYSCMKWYFGDIH
jgi:serine/threonine protein kinase